jgi:beta-lactamase class A
VTLAATPRLAEISPLLDSAPGTISVYCGPLGGPAVLARAADQPHYAASTMKVAVLAALYRAAAARELDLDSQVTVHNDFDSALPGGGRFGLSQSYDQDDEVWKQLGRPVPLRWLARHMIVKSGNLATNLILERVGQHRVAQVWSLIGAPGNFVGRGIEDAPARAAGIQNVVTAAGLAALLSAIALAAQAGAGHPLVDPASAAQMLEVLFAQEHREDLAAGLPPGTRIAHKNGWVEGIRHGAGVVFPDDCAPYVIVVCTTTDWASGHDGGDDACRLIAWISAAAWADRHALASAGQ